MAVISNKRKHKRGAPRGGGPYLLTPSSVSVEGEPTIPTPNLVQSRQHESAQVHPRCSPSDRRPFRTSPRKFVNGQRVSGLPVVRPTLLGQRSKASSDESPGHPTRLIKSGPERQQCAVSEPRKLAKNGRYSGRERPIAAARQGYRRCSAASPDRSFVHRAEFSESEGRQSGTNRAFSPLRLRAGFGAKVDGHARPGALKASTFSGWTPVCRTIF